MFQPKFLKHAKLLHKGVTRFLHYKRDLLPAPKLNDIVALRTQLEGAIKRKDKAEIESLSKTINKTCETAMPEARVSEIAENIEVFFVSIIIALGIRTYIAQPFQIPTSSMQPTLNGIIAESTDEDPRNGILGFIPNFLTGTTRLNVVSDHTGWIDPRNPDFLTQHQFFIFRPYCRLNFTDGHSIKIKCPKQQLLDELRLEVHLGLTTDRRAAANPDMRPEVVIRPTDGAIQVQKGQLLARGLVRNGDHVIVNKFAYHFRKPTRGEVFVFTTKNISGIEDETRFDARMGSQHYIKRLTGIPGDTLEVKLPAGEELWPERDDLWYAPPGHTPQRIKCELWVNGAKATEPGIKRVMERFDEGYLGYTRYMGRGFSIHIENEENQERYVAMGDNSARSSDSRSWGTVPEQNLVGPGWFCYWPLTKHWGPIR